jgi:integrase
MTLAKADILRITKTNIDDLARDARDELPVTWFKTHECDYQVLSRYGDAIWAYPDSRFPAGVKASEKAINFDTIPPAFRTTLKFVVRRYDLAETPAGNTLVRFVADIRPFLRYLAEMRVTRLARVNQMHCANYAEYCRQVTSSRGTLLSPNGLLSRFSAVEKLQRLTAWTSDAFSRPWPDASAKHLAGLTGQGPRQAKTLIIPDPIWKPVFHAANARLEEADLLFELRARVDALRERIRKEGWSSTTALKHASKLVGEYGYQGLKAFDKQFRELQSAAMVVILSLSGIRVHELCYLKNDAWYVSANDGERTHWMRSRSDKTGAGDTEWLIPERVTKALDVAQRFAAPLQALLDAQRNDLLAADPRSPDAHTLFRDREKLFLGVTPGQGNRIAGMSAASILGHINRFAAANSIDWHFTPHQFRRTFARYVARSEYGDLRYLREHFKHWSLDMTTLYAENQRQDAELYDEIMAAVVHENVEIVTHWLDEDVLITGGCAGAIRAFRTDKEQLRTYEDRRAMALRIADTVFIRATGAAWCTADDGGCGGRGIIEATRCGDCANSVIDDKNLRRWTAIYQQQQELRDIENLGPGAQSRIERDIQRCEQVLSDLGALERVQKGLTTKPEISL